MRVPRLPPEDPPPPPLPDGRPRGDRARLSVLVTGTKPIPNGALVEMRFRVSKDLKDFMAKVQQRSEAFAPDKSKVETLITTAGEVLISDQPKGAVPIIFGCFFYMH